MILLPIEFSRHWVDWFPFGNFDISTAEIGVEFDRQMIILLIGNEVSDDLNVLRKCLDGLLATLWELKSQFIVVPLWKVYLH